MSAPLVINLRDGSVWERRAVTAAGVALYALAGSCKCPEFLMASESELAAQGIAGTADVLPVPVGAEPRSRSVLDRARDALGARMSKDDLRLVLENTIAYAAGLEAERHSTNESLDEAAQALREKQKREAIVTEFVAARAEYITAIRNCHPDNGHDYDRWQGHAAARRQLAELLGLPVAWPPEDAVSVAKAADRLTALMVPSQALRENSPKCRCSEPDADPYTCEADDCTHEFSELNPFGGGSGPVEGHDAKVSRACGKCDYRTSVWHVGDGSAEAELHGHVVRVHGGVYPAESGGAS